MHLCAKHVSFLCSCSEQNFKIVFALKVKTCSRVFMDTSWNWCTLNKNVRLLKELVCCTTVTQIYENWAVVHQKKNGTVVVSKNFFDSCTIWWLLFQWCHASDSSSRGSVRLTTWTRPRSHAAEGRPGSCRHSWEKKSRVKCLNVHVFSGLDLKPSVQSGAFCVKFLHLGILCSTLEVFSHSKACRLAWRWDLRKQLTFENVTICFVLKFACVGQRGKWTCKAVVWKGSKFRRHSTFVSYRILGRPSWDIQQPSGERMVWNWVVGRRVQGVLYLPPPHPSRRWPPPAKSLMFLNRLFELALMHFVCWCWHGRSSDPVSWALVCLKFAWEGQMLKLSGSVHTGVSVCHSPSCLSFHARTCFFIFPHWPDIGQACANRQNWRKWGHWIEVRFLPDRCASSCK